MGIIKRADLESYTRDAVPMDLDDLHRRGQSVIAAAQEQAAHILKQANEERARLIGDATKVGTEQGYEEGFSKGTAEGIEQGTLQAREDHTQQLDSLNEHWTKALELWERDRSDLMLAARTEVIELAAHIASRVIKRVIDLDPEVVVDQLETVLETLVTKTDIRICVPPGDVELLKRVMPAMIERCPSCDHADLVEDDKLAPGSCVVSTMGGGEIDASISTQFDRVVAALLPAHRGPEYDKHLEEDSKELGPDSESKGDAA
jgi:flagellar assembly protein FliH